MQTLTSEMQKKIIERFNALKENQKKIKLSSAQERKTKLLRLKKIILEKENEIIEALHRDFKKPPTETKLNEIYIVTNEIDHSVRHLNKWMKPKKVGTPISLFGARSEIIYESKGISLVLSPWNFPFQLAIAPLVSAISAGNCVILKPSEISSHTSFLIEKLISETFDENEVFVFEGDHTIASALLELPFDHIFFTGSPAIGKIVMKAAAKNLSSVTLELGGKSPTIIDDTADLKTAAERITWGKFLNGGQTCIAPDYVFVHEKVYDEFLSNMKVALVKHYGQLNNMMDNSDYARIINYKHFSRIKNLVDDAKLKGAEIKIGGQIEMGEMFFGPTVISNVSLNSTLMEEEIFGPVIPVLKFTQLDEVITEITKLPKPLALYIFSRNDSNIDNLIKNISSGSVVVNDVVIQFGNLNLPFGGVNNSGTGNSHGFYGFKAFSHERSVMRRGNISTMNLVYPPYTDKVNKVIELMRKYL